MKLDPIDDDINAAKDVKKTSAERQTDPRMENDGKEKVNPLERAESAKQFAQRHAKLEDRHTVDGVAHKYVVLELLHEGTFGYTYKVEQVDTHNVFAMRTEPWTEEDCYKKFKNLKNELLVLKDIKSKGKSSSAHFVQLVDQGGASKFKYIVTTLLGDNLYKVTRDYLNGSFSQSTALRVSIQMLRALMDLHTIGYVHRFLKPHAFAHGVGSAIKVVHLCSFSIAHHFRTDNGVKSPRRHVKFMGALRYASRNSHQYRELSRRDDLESWLYLSMEFFHANVLPWRGDQISASVLLQKDKFFNEEFPKMFNKTASEYRNIMRCINRLKFDETPDYSLIMQSLQDAKTSLNCDFALPYDWEVLTKDTSKASTKPLSPPTLSVSMTQDVKSRDSKFPEETMATQNKNSDAEKNFNAAADIVGKDMLIDVLMEGPCKNAKDQPSGKTSSRSDSEDSRDVGKDN